MPVIKMMGPDTFQVISDEPRDQLIQASMDDYTRAVDSGQIPAWRGPAEFNFDREAILRQAAIDRIEAPVHGQSLQPLGYEPPGVGGGGGGGGGRAAYTAPQPFPNSPSYGMDPLAPNYSGLGVGPLRRPTDAVYAEGGGLRHNPAAPQVAPAQQPFAEPLPWRNEAVRQPVASPRPLAAAAPPNYQTFLGPMAGGYNPPSFPGGDPMTRWREAPMPPAWEQARELYGGGLTDRDRQEIEQLRGYMGR